MPCEIENGIVKRYLPCVEEQEVETADGFVHMRVTEIGVKVPEGVRRVGAYAFCDCRVLQRILLPEGLEEISPLWLQREHSLASRPPASTTVKPEYTSVVLSHQVYDTSLP